MEKEGYNNPHKYQPQTVIDSEYRYEDTSDIVPFKNNYSEIVGKSGELLEIPMKKDDSEKTPLTGKDADGTVVDKMPKEGESPAKKKPPKNSGKKNKKNSNRK